MAALVDKSLLRQEDGPDGESRFVMLETIRAYALERLVEFGGAEALKWAQAAHYLALAEMAESHLEGPQQQAWLTRLEADHDNLRAAIQWEVERRNTEAALRFGAALWRFWWKHGYLSEGQNRLEAILALPETGPGTTARNALRASVLLGAGRLANDQADYRAARAYCQESQAIWQTLDDQLLQALGAKQNISDTLNGLGCAAMVIGNYGEAETRFGEALDLRRAIGDRRGCAAVLVNLGNAALMQDNSARGRIYYQDALAGARVVDDFKYICCGLEGLAAAAVLAGEAERAARLLGAAEVLHESVGFVNDSDQRLVVDRAVDRARAQLGAEAFVTAWEAGRALPLEQAIAEALEPLSEVTPPVTPERTTPTDPYPVGLTRREVEVLRLGPPLSRCR